MQWAAVTEEHLAAAAERAGDATRTAEANAGDEAALLDWSAERRLLPVLVRGLAAHFDATGAWRDAPSAGAPAAVRRDERLLARLNWLRQVGDQRFSWRQLPGAVSQSLLHVRPEDVDFARALPHDLDLQGAYPFLVLRRHAGTTWVVRVLSGDDGH